MGSVSCDSEGHTPKDERTNQQVNDGYPDPVWPFSPRHDGPLLVTGGDQAKSRAAQNDTDASIDSGDARDREGELLHGANEHNFETAVKNALSPQAEANIMKQLCGKCCKKVRITVKTGDDDWSIFNSDGIENAVSKFSDFKGGGMDDNGEYSKVVNCPK